MVIRYHTDLLQGSDEWLAARCGLLTASEMKHIVTPGEKPADNDKTRAHLYELLAQRITQHVEPTYIGDDMLRGMDDEVWARKAYHENVAAVHDAGFVTNDRWGFTIGYSPDWLVGEDGLAECKSRRQKFQVQTIILHVQRDRCATIPADYLFQVQTGLLVTERKWCDFVSYSGGLPMAVIRVYPDDKVQSAIVDAATDFEERLQQHWAEYRAAMAADWRLIPTERRIQQEIFA